MVDLLTAVDRRYFVLLCFGGARKYFRATSIEVVAVLGVLREAVYESVADGLGGDGGLVFHHEVLFAQFFEPRVLDCLAGRYAVIGVVNQQLADQVFHFFTRMWDQFHNSRALSNWEVELHVCRVLLKLLKQVRLGGSADVVDLVNLV